MVLIDLNRGRGGEGGGGTGLEESTRVLNPRASPRRVCRPVFGCTNQTKSIRATHTGLHTPNQYARLTPEKIFSTSKSGAFRTGFDELHGRDQLRQTI